jgi:hypothetical protein
LESATERTEEGCDAADANIGSTLKLRNSVLCNSKGSPDIRLRSSQCSTDLSECEFLILYALFAQQNAFDALKSRVG